MLKKKKRKSGDRWMKIRFIKKIGKKKKKIEMIGDELKLRRIKSKKDEIEKSKKIEGGWS